MRLGIQGCARIATVAGLAAAALASHSASADEFKLKDGSKITGTIVGFDDNSFKVKTSYGFAVVLKDQVVSISITPAAKSDDQEKKAEPTSEKPPTPAKPAKPEAASATPASKSATPTAAHPEGAPETAISAQPTAASASPATKKTEVSADAKPKTPAATAATASGALPAVAGASSAPNANASTASAAPVPANATPPAKPAAPEPIRESVDGNTYKNETYGFQMYKPPDWEVIASASTLMPGAITAMGTGDQSTYLLIGQGPVGKTLASDEDAADHRLRDIMENFRALDVQHVTVSGAPAIERHFRGSVDQHDWSGVLVLVPHGSQLYTIFGMTIADNDLVQIQENVIARAISSLQFAKQ